MKFGEPINENREPETSAEKHFAYLNSKSGEEEYFKNFKGNIIEGLFNSKDQEKQTEKKNELVDRLAKFEKVIRELTITVGVIHELASNNTVNANSSYLLLLNKIKEIIISNNDDSANSQRIIEKATIAKNCITELRDLNKITDNSNLSEIIGILQNNLTEFKRKLGEI